ncbi:MAG: hypothetical protein K0S22_753 [Oscillospiraceae bacterium]|jgi:hypothetical protein|nr:hypothetical protein [Oscillospiraceae bacterium]
MELLDMIKDIKKASAQGRLVVFIGAGVSVNSGYKLWHQLIALFNKELEYPSSSSSGFSTDEMLKISQYYYLRDKKSYYSIIKREYGKLPNATNAIINEILHLNPMHIITTNFDLLIEKSLEENHIYGNTIYGSLEKFSIIRSDSDFVNAVKKNYLVKMHGDVKSLKNLVLKEEDYLKYSNTHILIETFIKSLFVNYTFLFIGYRLGDYNIKLIMSWVDSIVNNQKKLKDNKRFSYYFVNSESIPLNNYEKEYYEKNNIFVMESSEIPAEFQSPHYDSNKCVFDDERGNNLLRLCKYINYGKEINIAKIKEKLAVFDNINSITIAEIDSALEMPDYVYQIVGHDLYLKEEGLSLQLKTIIDVLLHDSNTDEKDYFSSVFIKAGINTIHSEYYNDLLIELDNSKMKNSLYDTIINCDYFTLYKLSCEDFTDQHSMLKIGYLCAVLNAHKKAEKIFNQIIPYYKSSNDLFNLLICDQNLSKISTKQKQQIWYVIKDILSEEDKIRFITLYNYLNDSTEVYLKSIKVLRNIGNKFNANTNMVSFGDKPNYDFLSLRYSIHQIQKYFIVNSIYIQGLSGYTFIIGNWLKTLDIYIEILFVLHSSNSKVIFDNQEYDRTPLEKEDIYILITCQRNRNFEFLVKKYNVKNLCTFDGCDNYLLTLINNYICALECQNIVTFELANQIKNLLLIFRIFNLEKVKYAILIEYLTKLIIKILTLPFQNRDYYFNVFRDVILDVIETIFVILRKHKENIQQELFQSLIEGVLNCFNDLHDKSKFELGLAIFGECGILLNLSSAFSHYYNGKIKENTSDSFFKNIFRHYPNMLKRFIIELFPVLSEQQKLFWRIRVCNDIEGLEPILISLAITNDVIKYNGDVCKILVNYCRRQINKRSQKGNGNTSLTPLHCVLRLVEKELINDLEPYKEFIGHDDFFDFVCFPMDFDFLKYNTEWGTLLTLDKYREIAFKDSYQILKDKYQYVMDNGPSETEKAIYYKYFY